MARIFSALGATIHAYTARPQSTPTSRRDQGFVIPGTGDLDGSIPTKWYSGIDRPSFRQFLLSGLDLVVVCLPLTSETRGLLSGPEFAILASTSIERKRELPCFLVNVSRGPIVDQVALYDALHRGQLSGAALDVADPEPLPSDDPLWKAPNCFISPHISWSGTRYLERCLDILVLNLERRGKGLEMVNLSQWRGQ